MYLRRYASDKLTELIASVLDEAADVTEKTKEMNDKISGIIESKKGDASQMMNDKISEVLASSGPRCLCNLPTACQASLRTVHTCGCSYKCCCAAVCWRGVLCTSSGEVAVPEGVPGDADEMKSNLEGMIKSIGEQVTRVAVGKMDTTTTTLIAVICSVLDQLAAAYETAKGKGGLDGSGNLNEESVEALKEDVRSTALLRMTCLGC